MNFEHPEKENYNFQFKYFSSNSIFFRYNIAFRSDQEWFLYIRTNAFTSFFFKLLSILARVLFSRNFAYAKFCEKSLQNAEITLSFTNISKSWPRREFLASQICLLTLFAKIKFSRKFQDLQYYFLLVPSIWSVIYQNHPKTCCPGRINQLKLMEFCWVDAVTIYHTCYLTLDLLPM